MNQSKAATECCTREAASSRSSRTKSRKARRLRAKAKFEYTRAQLIAAKPVSSWIQHKFDEDATCSLGWNYLSSLPQARADQAVPDFKEHLTNIDCIDALGHEPLQLGRVPILLAPLLLDESMHSNATSGMSADVLKKHCQSARVLQRWWRKYIASKAIGHSASLPKDFAATINYLLTTGYQRTTLARYCFHG